MLCIHPRSRKWFREGLKRQVARHEREKVRTFREDVSATKLALATEKDMVAKENLKVAENRRAGRRFASANKRVRTL